MHYHYSSKVRLYDAIVSRLKRIPGLLEHPAFSFQLGLEGYQNYVFGCRAGSSLELSNLFHEIAHAVEFGAKNFRYRVNQDGRFNFKQPKEQYIFGRVFIEFYKTTAIECELRTIAIQIRLLKMSGVKTTYENLLNEIVDSMVWMPDFENVQGDGDKEKLEWCRKYVTEYYSTLNDEQVVSEIIGWLDKTEKRLKRNKKWQEHIAEKAMNAL